MYKSFERNALWTTLVVAAFLLGSISSATADGGSTQVRYGYENVGGVNIFFREAGDATKPKIVMLHGFPSSSHQYRNLIRELADNYHVIAPDYPGFGASDFPSQDTYTYTFDNFAETIDLFLQQRNFDRYSLVIHDYGAPVGMRIAQKHPERVQSLIVQNGNIYEEGLNKKAWAPIMKLWEKRTPELEKTIAKNVFGLGGLKWQYTHGTRQPERILPDNWLLDFQSLSRAGQHAVQLDLFYDYRNNVKRYPEWQAYIRKHQPPVLIVWAKNDAFFSVAGAEAFKRDAKSIEFHVFDTGHFALEENGPSIARKIDGFMKVHVAK